MNRQHIVKGGFALPTVLIASVVMLTILATSVTSVVAVRNSLKVQYYEQLAKLAGEAGVAYAKACLAGNGNVPLWTDAKPLTPGSDCSGNESGCPSDPKCSVLVEDNLRSSFTVKLPKLDLDGRAIAIPNNGYVELLRSSNGAVWRTYYQPSVQAAVVPDLCSGAAESGEGWSNAVMTTTQDALTNAPAAKTISISNSAVAAGSIYLRKDFNITTAGTYYILMRTPTTQDKAELYIDGVYVSTSQGAHSSVTQTLAVGCHTVTIKLTNNTLADRQTRVTASIQRQTNTAPIVQTDRDWRVSSGNTAHFSEVQYYPSSVAWTTAKETTSPSGVTPAVWAAGTGDPQAAFIASSCDTVCPPSSSTYFRDGRDFVLSSTTTLDLYAACDDNCSVFIDGEVVMNSALWSNLAQRKIELAAGVHHVGVRLYNSGTATNPSKFIVTLKDGSGTVLTRTDNRWLTANNTWVSGSSDSNPPRSYQANFRPSPKEILDSPTFDIVVVGGGGGGSSNAAGGGGGGGVRVFEDVAASVGSYSVVVGAGGNGAGTGVVGTAGGYSQFSSATYRSLGGGGGAARDSSSSATGGGSGGGGAGAYYSGNSYLGAAGTSGQGGKGGNGTPPDASCSAAGGGGGGGGGNGNDASNTIAGHGGPGVILYLTGGRLGLGGGGGGSVTCSGTVGTGADGGGRGSGAVAGAANTGGGGGATGGAGGSGIVIVRYRTGTVTATGGTVTTATIDGVAYTVHSFKTVGTTTFTVTSVKSY